MMYSTQKNIATKIQKNNAQSICGKYIQYPDTTNLRSAEGGLRLQGKFKKSLPQQPLLTIITVVKNKADTIEECILSVLEQDYYNIEYIVIDGGSTDGTLDIINKYENAIDYYISEPDQGLYFAMNKGISLASGDIINFINADDYFLRDVFREYANKFQNIKIKMVYAHTEVRDTQGNFVCTTSSPVYTVLLFPISHSACFIQRAVFETIGYFDTSYSIAADYHFLLSTYLFYTEQAFACIKRTTIIYRLGGISDIRNALTMQESVNIQMKLYGEMLNIPESFFLALSSHVPRSENNALSPIFDNIHFNKKTSTKILFNFLKAYIYVVEHKIFELENNYWYRFGQYSKKQKTMTIFSFMAKFFLRIFKRGGNKKKSLG